jgi:tetratricopeptide (TPR) repeat protein
MLFEDLTFIPGFNVLVMVLAATALADAGAIHWRTIARPKVGLDPGAGRLRRWGLAVGLGLGAAALLAIMLLGDASAVAYRLAADAAGAAHWGVATDGFARAVTLDPWQPTGPKSLAVAADRAGREEQALAAARRAVQLNPGDGPSWVNLAVLCHAADDRGCARQAADRAVDSASAAGRELANAAEIYAWLGDQQAADRAYRLSLLTNFWTGLTLPWPRPIAVGDGSASELDVGAAELNLLIARRVTEEPIHVDDYAAPLTRALADAMLGDRDAAWDEIERAMRSAKDSTTVWEVAALLARQDGLDPQPYVAISNVTRGAPLISGGSGGGGGRLVYDIATFRAYPADGLVRDAVRLQPDVPWPWVLEKYLAK